jgi:hypothetical protein
LQLVTRQPPCHRRPADDSFVTPQIFRHLWLRLFLIAMANE